MFCICFSRLPTTEGEDCTLGGRTDHRDWSSCWGVGVSEKLSSFLHHHRPPTNYRLWLKSRSKKSSSSNTCQSTQNMPDDSTLLQPYWVLSGICFVSCASLSAAGKNFQIISSTFILSFHSFGKISIFYGICHAYKKENKCYLLNEITIQLLGKGYIMNKLWFTNIIASLRCIHRLKLILMSDFVFFCDYISIVYSEAKHLSLIIESTDVLLINTLLLT